MIGSHKMSFNKMRSVFFFALIIALGIAMLYLFRPFFYPIFWAAVIAVMFYPLYRWLGTHFKSTTLNAFLTITAVVFILLFPLMILTILIARESLDLYRSITAEDLRAALSQASSWLSNTPLAPYLQQIQENWPQYAQQAAQKTSSVIIGSITSVTQNSLRFIIMLFLMFYTLYYFLKDGKRMLGRLMHLSPLGDKYEEMLYERFTSTTRATLKSTLIIGGIQGIIGGLLFWITGIEGAFIWGVIMVIFGIIPAVGPALILSFAAGIMLLLGFFWQGLLLLIGAFFVSLIDNFLRPPLIGRDTQMHPLIVLFATLGGLVLFNVSGFVIGPILAALFISVMSMYDHYYKRQLERN